MDHVLGSLWLFSKPPLGGRPDTKPVGDHGTPNAPHNRWFLLFYHMLGPAWKKIHWNSIWSRAWWHMTSHYTWESMTTLNDVGGELGQWPLDTHFLLGSHYNFMVTALGSFVKWPEVMLSLSWLDDWYYLSQASCIYLLINYNLH